MVAMEGSTVPRQASSLTARRMARTRRELAAAAAQMFKERGYEATTVEDICAAVEVSPRTFFRYFQSKEDVVNELLDSHLDTFVAALATRPPDEAVLASLVAAASCGYETSEPDFVELFAVVHRTPALRARWLDRAHEVQARLAAVLGKRLASEEVARLAAGALVGTMTTVIETWAERHDDTPLRRRVVEALELLAAGFGLAEPVGGKASSS
jgi:AcrR family transcriptional regulator